jgi:8-oxo-dGTP pyrophosphatase MutT (NUDIX family)
MNATESTITKAVWLCVRNRRVLAARSKGKSAFYLPGGKPDSGESSEQALIREVKEELCVDLVPESIAFMQHFSAPAHGKSAGTTLRMDCFGADYVGEVSPSNEIEEVAWLTYDDHEKGSAAFKLVLDELRARGAID